MAARVDIRNGSLIGILFSKQKENLPWIIKRLEQRREEIITAPLIVLTLLHEEYSDNVEKWRANLDREVVRIEQTTGMTSFVLADLDDHTWEEMEYPKLIRDLHACNNNLTFLGDLIHFEIELGEFCHKLFDKFEDLRKSAGRPAIHTRATKDKIHRRLEFLSKLSHFRQQQTNSLRQRIQSQINLVSLAPLNFDHDKKVAKHPTLISSC